VSTLYGQSHFAHPLVEGITWWDISDDGWLNAPAGLIRKDGSTKPAYDALLKLVKDEWWSAPPKLATDSNGKIRFSGFLGEYELAYGGKHKLFSLTKENATAITVEF
jgi:endo-1,4-beta-xylanase